MVTLLRRRCAAATAVLLLAASAAGCSGDSDEPRSGPSSSESASEASASPSPSPSSTRTSKPKLPKAPPAKATVAGREAFAELVIDRWGYALRTNDASAVTDLSPEAAPCQGCPDLQQELAKRRKQGWYVDFPGAEVVKVELAAGDLPGVQVATAKIDVPASESYFKDGELRNESDAHKGATFEVRMRLDGKRYVLLAFRVF